MNLQEWKERTVAEQAKLTRKDAIVLALLSMNAVHLKTRITDAMLLESETHPRMVALDIVREEKQYNVVRKT